MQKRNLPNRKSIRLKGWDYRNPGLYFITICTKDRKHHFGEIKDGVMGLSVLGCLTLHYWREIPNHHSRVVLDEFVVMPNHIHGIIGITGDYKPVGSAIHRDPGMDEDREKYEDRDSDANNRVPTGLVAGGVTGEHNPMLYEGHLGRIIRWFKGRCTYEIRKRNFSDFAWQSRFYDHIIRNNKSLYRIRDYIADNPLRWHVDRENRNVDRIEI